MTHLNLSNNGFNIISGRFEEILRNIPQHVVSLNLSKNNLYIFKTLKGLPSHFSSLNLSENQLGTLSNSNFEIFLTGISDTVKCLILDQNSLVNYSGEELNTIFSKIADRYQELSLRKNKLGQTCHTLPADFLAKFTNLEILNLAENDLGLAINGKIDLFQSLPPSVKSVDVSNNKLAGEGATLDFEAFLAAYPETLQSLNLSNNQLNHLTPLKLQNALRAIKAKLTCIDLSDNQLGDLSIEDWKAAFAHLPPSVSTLKLHGNTFKNNTSFEAINKIFNLPSSIKTLYLDPEIFKALNKPRLLNLFANKFKHIFFEPVNPEEHIAPIFKNFIDQHNIGRAPEETFSYDIGGVILDYFSNQDPQHWANELAKEHQKPDGSPSLCLQYLKDWIQNYRSNIERIKLCQKLQEFSHLIENRIKKNPTDLKLHLALYFTVELLEKNGSTICYLHLANAFKTQDLYKKIGFLMSGIALIAMTALSFYVTAGVGLSAGIVLGLTSAGFFTQHYKNNRLAKVIEGIIQDEKQILTPC